MKKYIQNPIIQMVLIAITVGLAIGYLANRKVNSDVSEAQQIYARGYEDGARNGIISSQVKGDKGTLFEIHRKIDSVSFRNSLLLNSRYGK